jgi:dihydropteroate synthase
MSDQPISLQCGKHKLILDNPVVMGILNTTPDSFSDGGQHYAGHTLRLDSVLRHAEAMLIAGAKIIDVGGESTRPGAAIVSEQEELSRVIPVVEALVKNFDAIVSVDTGNPQVITESAKVGAGIINDIRALQVPGALIAAKNTGLPVCLMHMQGDPATMQLQPNYDDVIGRVRQFLEERVAECLKHGVLAENIILDPGFGFGKSLEHNLQLLQRMPEILELGYPILSGLSRKTMFGQLLNRTVDKRLAGSLAGAMVSVQKGAKIIRVHDVPETVDVLKVLHALNACVQSELKEEN